MQRFVSVMFLGLLVTSPSFAGSLKDEIKRWRPGSEVPYQLLVYPSGNVTPPSGPMCSFARDSVWPYIEEIGDDRLLEELVYDGRSESETFAAASIKLIERKGLPWFAAKLESREASRWELQWLRQMLRSPAARISVAFVEKADMPEPRAEAVLSQLKVKLDSGQPWSDAYRTVADANPDIERMRKEPGTQTTLITYAFDGWVSEIGFSYSSLSVTPYVPAAYFEKAITAGAGGHLYKDEGGVYLLYVFDLYSRSPNTSLERAEDYR
jgi:hypothetical protein